MIKFWKPGIGRARLIAGCALMLWPVASLAHNIAGEAARLHAKHGAAISWGTLLYRSCLPFWDGMSWAVLFPPFLAGFFLARSRLHWFPALGLPLLLWIGEYLFFMLLFSQMRMPGQGGTS